MALTDASGLKAGPLASLPHCYAAKVEINDRLRGQLAAMGRNKPPSARMAVVPGSKRLPQGVSAKQFLEKLTALRSENEEFTNELRVLAPASAQPVSTAPKLTESERIFATWESLTGEMKTLYFREHRAVLSKPRPSSIDGLTEDDRANEIFFQLVSEGVLPAAAVSPSAISNGTPPNVPPVASVQPPPLQVDATEAIFAHFDSLNGAKRTAYYRKHEGLLRYPFLRPSHARQGRQSVAAAPALASANPNAAIFAKFAELKGAAKSTFYREHRAVLRHPNHAANAVENSPQSLAATDAWKDPAPELFARFDSLGGAAKSDFYRQHKAVLSRPRDFYATKA